MSKRVFILSIVTFSLLFIGALEARAQVLYTEDLRPFNYVKGRILVGLGPEIIRLVKKVDPELSFDMKVLPWKRAYALAQNERNNAVFSLARTAKREDLFHWVGPIFSIQTFLWAKGPNAKKIKKIKDVVGMRITTQQGGSGEQELKDLGFEHIVGVVDTDRMYKMLINDRVDLMKVPDLMIADYLARNDLPINAIIPVWGMGKRDLYIGFSKSTDLEYIHRWNRAIEAVWAMSEYDEILKKYGSLVIR